MSKPVLLLEKLRSLILSEVDLKTSEYKLQLEETTQQLQERSQQLQEKTQQLQIFEKVIQGYRESLGQTTGDNAALPIPNKPSETGESLCESQQKCPHHDAGISQLSLEPISSPVDELMGRPAGNRSSSSSSRSSFISSRHLLDPGLYPSEEWHRRVASDQYLEEVNHRFVVWLEEVVQQPDQDSKDFEVWVRQELHESNERDSFKTLSREFEKWVSSQK